MDWPADGASWKAAQGNGACGWLTMLPDLAPSSRCSTSRLLVRTSATLVIPSFSSSFFCMAQPTPGKSPTLSFSNSSSACKG